MYTYAQQKFRVCNGMSVCLSMFASDMYWAAAVCDERVGNTHRVQILNDPAIMARTREPDHAPYTPPNRSSTTTRRGTAGGDAMITIVLLGIWDVYPA